MDGVNRKKFSVQYFAEGKFTHQYVESWIATSLCCPRCGEKKVWIGDDRCDYEVGEKHICVACKATFYLPSGVNDADDEQDHQRLRELTSHKFKRNSLEQ